MTSTIMLAALVSGPIAQNYIFAESNVQAVVEVDDSVEVKLAAPCGLYCGSCVDYLEYKNCHGCSCMCGNCAGLAHQQSCDIYKCCVEKKGVKTCADCDELPCSKLIQFCYSPIWTHHLPVIENLRRQKTVGKEKWVKEQREVWSNEWYLKRWVWLQKECENKLRKFKEGS